MELKMRKDIPVELTWDLTSIYAAEEDMRKDEERLRDLCAHAYQLQRKFKHTGNHQFLP